MHNFGLILKIFTDFIEQVFRPPHIKYLRDWMILKFSYNYHIITDILEFDNLSGLQRMFT